VRVNAINVNMGLVVAWRELRVISLVKNGHRDIFIWIIKCVFIYVYIYTETPRLRASQPMHILFYKPAQFFLIRTQKSNPSTRI